MSDCSITKYRLKYLFIFAASLALLSTSAASPELSDGNIDQKIFIRFKIVSSNEQNFSVKIDGFRHEAPWYFPPINIKAKGGEWSDWIDLSGWQWHGKMDRSGGIAEYPSVGLTLNESNLKGCAFDVELSDAPDERNVAISFSEKSASNKIAFLVPYPLRANAKDFETGSQMTKRHAMWAREAVAGGKPIFLKKFEIITSLWGHYDPSLAVQEASSLKLLGFNTLGNVNFSVAKQNGLRTYKQTGIYAAEPEKNIQSWKNFVAANLQKSLATPAGIEEKAATTHWVISDEISALDFRGLEPSKLNGWFRAYLKNKNVSDEAIGEPIDEVQYPAAAMYADALPQDAPLQKRRLLYYAAKFGQYWSAKQLRQTTDLIRGTFPGMDTEALLPSHGFFGNAWGAANIGMSYRMQDIFEVGAQQSVSQLSAEDWFGLNHMYGANHTWTGAQSFGYYNAILRSAIGDKPLLLRGLITPSDDKYLRLKAYSSLAQGAKSFFFWTFGPTYIGTENYWSDLRSEYDGIAKLNRSLQKSEDVLYPAKPVADPVAVLYSVSHDIWNTNHQAAFVEKRLLWHALRHLQIQPNFLREEAIEAGALKNYEVLYLTDWCVSRKASAAIDDWIKTGGVVYLSAGAATRDEFDEPYSPPFASAVWENNAAKNLITENHTYNERTDLPNIKPLTTANVEVKKRKFDLPVIGVRSEMKPTGNRFAIFKDGATAGGILNYGRGKIIAVGFLPMLAYGQLADFKPTTLEEKWKSEPREIIKMVLDLGKIDQIIKTDVPVVEASFLRGENGAAIVLANYTYQPINALTIDLQISKPFKKAFSVEGEKIRIVERTPDRIRLKIPLKWTDIIILR